MRKRIAAVALAAFAASAYGVTAAAPAGACLPEDCPLGCRLLDKITGHPSCPMQEDPPGTGVIKLP